MAVNNLLNARTTDGSGPTLAVKFRDRGPRAGTLFAYGTFDGATVTFEESPDGTTWFTIASGALTSKGTVKLATVMGYLRATISNDGATTSLSAGFQ